MRTRLLYVELKSGFGGNGPAWIGQGFFSKTGRTIYFNGHAFSRGSGVSGNYYDVETADEYWISGIKKSGNDRHHSGSGIVEIDEGVIGEYLLAVGKSVLPKNKFRVVKLDNVPPKDAVKEINNKQL